MTRRLVFFQGHVQGVGFRFTARRVASIFNVAGYVRNLPDGRVELVVEGTADEIERFLLELRQTTAAHVRHVDIHTLPATGEFSEFEIRH
jgi:acylphosphatase